MKGTNDDGTAGQIRSHVGHVLMAKWVCQYVLFQYLQVLDILQPHFKMIPKETINRVSYEVSKWWRYKSDKVGQFAGHVLMAK